MKIINSEKRTTGCLLHSHLCVNVRGNGISPLRILKYFGHLISSQSSDVLQVISDVGKMGGVGKEWDFVCLHECV